MDNQTIQRFNLEDLPEFQIFQQVNPQNPDIDARQAILMFGRAIHWLSIFNIIWPDFEKLNHLSFEVAYVVVNDPDDKYLPHSFRQYIAQMIAMFWKMQLEQKYPHGNWLVEIDDDPEITVYFKINSRSRKKLLQNLSSTSRAKTMHQRGNRPNNKMTELDHIRNNKSGEMLLGLGWLYTITSDEQGLSRLLEVMNIVASQSPLNWPNDEEWQHLLPNWFIKTFKKYTKKEAREIMNSTPLNKWGEIPWEFGSWVKAIKNRGWKWWSIKADEKFIKIVLSIEEWPASLEAFEQILIKSGLRIVSQVQIPS